MINLEKVKTRKNKKLVTFSITEDVNNQFIEIAKKLKINKSLLVEESIKEFLLQNKEVNDG